MLKQQGLVEFHLETVIFDITKLTNESQFFLLSKENAL